MKTDIPDPSFRHTYLMRSDRKGTVKKEVKHVFSLFRFLLSFHGIIYFDNNSYIEKHFIYKILSVVWILLVEGNMFYVIYSSVTQLLVSKSKEDSTKIAILMLNMVIRFLFHTRRKDIVNIQCKLVRFHTKICEDELPGRKIKLKLATIAILYEAFMFFHLVHRFYSYPKSIFKEKFWFIPSPFSKVFICLSLILSEVYLIQPLVTYYFCSVCYFLDETMIQFEYQLRKKYVNMELLLYFYTESADLIGEINRTCHPLLLAGFTLILSRAFKETFIGFLILDYNAYQLYHTAFTFSHFVFICYSGSCVLNSGLKIKNTFLKFSSEYQMRTQNLLILSNMNENLDGFRLLNSISIDLSLILSALGCLATYGIMIATFNTTNSATNGKE